MKKLQVFLLLLCVQPMLIGCSSNLVDPYVDQLEPPSTKLVESIVEALNSFKESRPYKNEWKIVVDKNKGVIETNWFPEHKGEVILKIQIAVWGTKYRIDVWQKGWLSSSPRKTTWSVRYERNIQNEIEKHNQAFNFDLGDAAHPSAN